MSELKGQYDEVVAQRRIIIDEINELKKSETLKRYFELNRNNEQLLEQQRKLYKEMKFEEYSHCNHILVNTCHDYDSWEGRSENFYGCIKCGLDQRVLRESSRFSEFLTFEQKIMLEFLRDRMYLSGNNTHILCDLDLAKAIYAKVKESHHDIDDDTARKYFEIALDNIRDIKVSDERKQGRAKRLSLHPNFNNWNGNDVCIRY